MNKDTTVALYQAIKAGNEPREFLHWHASSIAMCPRAHYLERLGQPHLNDPSAGKILRWSAGHAIETAIRPYIEAVYGEITSNMRLTSEKYDLTGEFDNLVVAGNRLVEIKSVHDFAFIERGGDVYLKEATGGTGPRGGKEYAPKQTPYLHHTWQNHAYALLLQEEGDKTVKEIDYVYISLGGRLAVYSTTVDPSISKKVVERLRLLYAHWSIHTPPPCTCQEGQPFWNEINQYCDFKNEETGRCCELVEKERKERT